MVHVSEKIPLGRKSFVVVFNLLFGSSKKIFMQLALCCSAKIAAVNFSAMNQLLKRCRVRSSLCNLLICESDIFRLLVRTTMTRAGTKMKTGTGSTSMTGIRMNMENGTNATSNKTVGVYDQV